MLLLFPVPDGVPARLFRSFHTCFALPYACLVS